MNRPQNRDTKPCPRCGKTATFFHRVERPGSRAGFNFVAENMTAAWRCNDAECDYFEEVD
jgi:hypothetical protein